ncbi:tyrosine--tRNA ligase [bacterium BMS3Abin05]|nr:tyrosine--tRNA ligase [bacterium BMS3Abin05]GBE28822.1 tyrosine--tRNA ligase [bacterium BMS3Bbin03]HDZ12616.1 tyrosine--tRNA ligase [Bacteroidota bacterium]
MFPSVNEQMDKIRRGVDEIIPEEELVKKLERSIKENKPLRIKEGFDPTAPDIHLGHMVSIRKLRQFQELGHQVIFLIGDFTGMIGDPSGRNEMRKHLTQKEVLKNAETYKEQIFKVLDPQKTMIDFNSRWHAKLKFEDVLTLTSKYTVARMLERDDFKKRMKAGKPISMMEFLYPLVQAYDSVALKADVELGGTDQKFNLLVGRDIMTEYGLEPQVILTLPLLIGLDGTEKMSKSLGNYIGINELPQEMYGKTMSIPDNLIYTYFELATDVPNEALAEIKQALADPAVNPMDLKRRLAFEIVKIYHGTETAKQAEEEFDRIFRQKKLPSDMPELRLSVSEGKIWIVRLMASGGLVQTNAEARRLIRQGAVSIDGRKVTNLDLEIELKDDFILKVGKRRFLKVVVIK